jgi:hypothetical protein
MHIPPDGNLQPYAISEYIQGFYDQGIAVGRAEWAWGMPYPSEPHASISIALRLDRCYQAIATASQSEYRLTLSSLLF